MRLSRNRIRAEVERMKWPTAFDEDPGAASDERTRLASRLIFWRLVSFSFCSRSGLTWRLCWGCE